jgi:hypothetical protein
MREMQKVKFTTIEITKNNPFGQQFGYTQVERALLRGD